MDAELRSLLLKKAGALLARRAYSRGEMRARLIKMAGETAVESILDRLEQLNLLNDADYAYNFAFRRTQREGWGPAKMQEALRRRGVSPAAIARALERVRNELSADSTLEALLERYCGTHGIPANPKDIQKLILYLQRRGFDEEAIRGVLRHRMPAAALRRFETGE
jgi:regulatory protein